MGNENQIEFIKISGVKKIILKRQLSKQLSEIYRFIGSVEDIRGEVNETLLEILNNDICNTEIAPRKPRTTQTMINKIVKRKAKTTNLKEYRRYNNQLRRETGRA